MNQFQDSNPQALYQIWRYQCFISGPSRAIKIKHLTDSKSHISYHITESNYLPEGLRRNQGKILTTAKWMLKAA